MKMKAVVAILLISMLLIDEAESWRVRFRGRRIIRRFIKPLVCRFVCPRVCTQIGSVLLRFGCQFACKNVCGRKRREAIDGQHVTPLPNYLSYYDMDDNNLVSMVEFADTLGHFDMEHDLILAFNMTDIDEDGMLTKDELFSSPCLQFAEPEYVNEDELL